jgi:hypothetical protein
MEISTLSFWDLLESIHAFAGPDIAQRRSSIPRTTDT